MKKLVLAIAATMMLTTASAQENNNDGQRGRRFDRTEMQKRQLDEMVKTYGLNEEQTEKVKALNEKFGDRLMPGFGGMRGMRGGGQRGGGMRPGGQNGNGMGPGAGGFGGGQRPQMTEEQRKQMEERRKEMEKAREEYETELKAIMTEEQFNAYQKDRQERLSRAPRGERRQRNNNQ